MRGSERSEVYQGRFLRALIDRVVVDEDKGTCRVELIDFGAAAGAKEAA